VTTVDPEPARLLPQLDDLNRAFWTGGANGQLLILRCRECRTWVHPPVERCTHCSGELVAEAVSGNGTVFTFTVNHQPYNPEVPVPYVIAVVELDEHRDLRLPANIVGCDPDDVEIGLAVRVAFEDHGEIFVPVFVPH
jgi:uncharacterized OB-fold protein